MYEELRKIYNPEGSERRTLQIELLDVLLAFDAFCRQNDVQYSLAQGTVLGAVRHKGFIPWDDDMDLMVTRENYDKLLAFDSQNGCLKGALRLCYVTAIPGLTLGNGFIDLMIVDNVPSNRIVAWCKKNVAAIIILLIKCRSVWDSGWWKTHLKLWHILIPFSWILPLKKWQQLLHEHVSVWGNRSKTPYKATYTDIPSDVGKKIPSDFFEEFSDIEFEGNMVRCIMETDKYLKIYYGDYMQLPKNIRTHGRTK